MPSFITDSGTCGLPRHIFKKHHTELLTIDDFLFLSLRILKLVESYLVIIIHQFFKLKMIKSNKNNQ